MFPVILLFAASSVHLLGQDAAEGRPPTDPAKTTRLTLGSATGSPGASVVVPIYFTPAEQESVGQASLTINFVSKNLKFQKIDPGAAAELGNVELTAESKDGKNDQGLEMTTITLHAAVPSGTDKAIPSGLLSYVSFNILETAVPANISLRVNASAVRAGSGIPASEVRAFGAQVEVLAEGEGGMVACFFFTH